MPDQAALETLAHLNSLGNVAPEGYSYYQKIVTPGQELDLPTAYLKWYNLRPVDVEITAEQVAESRAFLDSEVAKLNLKSELGFVILHRAGPVLLLLLSTWRNTNEIWESAYVKDLQHPGGYQPISFANNHRGAFCVWELGPVWHERNAWVRFLSSKRDITAKLAYMTDRFSGMI